jgi:hypothetical protein
VEIPPGTDPRERLAEWIVSPDNPAFAAAIVNRLWKHFFAVGLVEPVDDLRATNPPSNAPLLEALAGEFVRSGHDLRHLMKLLVTSRSYQLASDTTAANANDRRFHSHYYPRRLPGEVLADAIAKATAVPDTFAGVPEGTRAIQLPGPQAESYFLSTFGRSDRVTACACERSGDVTLPQLLHLQNSETILGKIRSDSGSLARLLAANGNGPAVPLVEGLFLATVSRLPDAEERAAVDAAQLPPRRWARAARAFVARASGCRVGGRASAPGPVGDPRFSRRRAFPPRLLRSQARRGGGSPGEVRHDPHEPAGGTDR